MLIYASAEAWGFGPASKLYAILEALSKRARPSVTVAVEGSAHTFFQTAYESLPMDIVVVQADARTRLEQVRDYDLVISVMDPVVALGAARAGLPSIYVDSLHDFWKWTPGCDLFEEANTWISSSTEDCVERLASPDLDWHRMVPLSYIWSTMTTLPGSKKLSSRIIALEQDVVPCGAVVGSALSREGRSLDRSSLLVSLSGSTSHVGSLADAAAYATAVVPLLVDAVPRHLRERMLVVAHPDLVQMLPALPLHPSLPPGRMHERIATAAAVLAPPGLTTAIECCLHGTPLILLPGQHGGHDTNRRALNSQGRAYESLSYDSESLPTDPSLAIKMVSRTCTELTTDASRARRLGALWAEQLREWLSSENLSRHAVQQKLAQERIYGSFDGAQAIAVRVTSMGDTQ